MNDTVAAKPPVPITYWIIALVSLLWNAFGGYDYVMSRLKDSAYLDAATKGKADIAIKWMDGLPLTAQIGWPVGVWFSVLGSVLLLIRSRHAATAFAISFLGAAVSFASEYLGGIPEELNQGAAKVLPLAILVLIAIQWWYARRAASRGWLG